MNADRRPSVFVAAVASPCTSVCTIDQASGLCAGCFRTLEEIAGWIRYSDEEKRALIDGLPARRQRMEHR